VGALLEDLCHHGDFPEVLISFAKTMTTIHREEELRISNGIFLSLLL
jgi:hypothetical protein